MKKLVLFILLLLPLIILAQDKTWHNDGIIDQWGWNTGQPDSVFFYGDTIWIVGPDSIHIYVPIDESLGMIKIKGTVTGTIWLTTDRHGVVADRKYTYGDTVTATFKIRPHSGDGEIDNTDISRNVAFSALGTCTMQSSSGDSTNGFSFYPLETVTTLKDEPTIFYDLSIVGAAGDLFGIWLEIEYLEAY